MKENDNMPITGGCICGAVRYESTAAPMLMLKCHCRDCQRISGGPYVPAVIFPFKAFRITKGNIQKHTTGSITGNAHVRGFCAECGSRLTGVEDESRGIIAVVASSLDDPSLFQSQMDIFVADAQPWDILDPATPKFEQQMKR